MKPIFRNFIIAHIMILFLMFVSFEGLTLISYINASFVLGGLLTFFGLVSYIFSTGFFDIFATSMRKVFTPKHQLEEIQSMRKPSEIFTASAGGLLPTGALLLVATVIALILYYVTL